ncbi:MAG: DNA polymerase/3'-5' exonuclease PolX [Chitinophagales bacterium]|nr:DNA polymerase/3'-5' exonuclease PolX [Chitinophagales bacterium]
MPSNREISSILKTLSELMELHGKTSFKTKSYASAAFQIGRLDDEVENLARPQLEKIINKSIIPKIMELKETGTLEMLEELIELTPPGIFEMMRIKGLGGKKLGLIWKKAGIENLEALLEACKNNELAQLNGFGEKTQQNILKSIEYYNANTNKFHLATVARDGEKIVESLKRVFKSDQVSLCGELRRQCNVVSGIEILCTLPSKKVIAKKSELPHLIIKSSSANEIKGHTINEIPFTIYVTSEEEYFYTLFKMTGNEEHVNKIISRVKDSYSVYESEEQIYKAAEVSYVLPEMRENLAEWDFIKKEKANNLVTDGDILGVVHNHTTWSDGIDTLKNFADACIRKGFQYAVISDHSKNAHYAGGLTEEQIIRQQEEIDALNKKIAPFKIFKSIECDILIDGNLDYNNDFLKRFDLVIISVHQSLKMDEEKATKRLLRAIENPYTTILGHMTGRKLLVRSGFPVDYKKIIDACAANNVIIEINANPYRLDMDYSHIPYALKKGVMISVNPDAHSIGEIDNIHWGITSARKGGLTKDMTWNAMTLKEIEKWLKNRRRRQT